MEESSEVIDTCSWAKKGKKTIHGRTSNLQKHRGQGLLLGILVGTKGDKSRIMKYCIRREGSGIQNNPQNSVTGAVPCTDGGLHVTYDRQDFCPRKLLRNYLT